MNNEHCPISTIPTRMRRYTVGTLAGTFYNHVYHGTCCNGRLMIFASEGRTITFNVDHITYIRAADDS